MIGDESGILEAPSLAREEAMNESRSSRKGGRCAGPETLALWILVVFNAAAVVGFATFGVHPEWLGRLPWAVPVFAASFRLFSIGQILVAAGVLGFVLTRRTGFAWLPALVAVYSISLVSELSGTAFGLPFGDYRYTAVLGPRWFDLVPLVIPLSWFLMAVPSFVLARTLHPAGGIASRVVLGSLILTAWDLALDPAMSHATYYWVWDVEGAYYGMPWVNLFGWVLTACFLMVALRKLGADRWTARLSPDWMAAFYSTNVLLALGMAAGAGLFGAVAVTVVGFGVIAGCAAWLRRRSRSRLSEVA